MTATQDVFELVLARPVRGALGWHSGLVHLAWSAPLQGDRFVQIYANDQLLDVTHDPTQRECWLLLDLARPWRIELLAVASEESFTPRPDLLTSWSPPVRSELSLTLVRDEALPVRSEVRATVDGQIVEQRALWEDDSHRGGFGALLGEGGFGTDAATGDGLGRGQLGAGALGADGQAWRWRDETLAPTDHTVSLQALDDRGQAVTPLLDLGTRTLESLPAAASTFTVDPDFTLRWTA